MSFDVESLITNVPVIVVLDAMKWYIGRHSQFLSRCIFSMDELLDLTDYLLRSCYFEFDGRFFVQLDGVSMGSSLGPAAANVYMNFFEYESFTLARELRMDIPVTWFRYVDDVLACWTHGENQLPRFLDFLNSRVDSIRFTMEFETEGRIPFLDILINRNGGSPVFSVYRKPTHSNLYLNRSSCHPRSVFGGVVKSLGLRASRLCSESTIGEELGSLRNTLLANGYQTGEIKQQLRSLDCNRTKISERRKIAGSIPFIPGISDVIKARLAAFDVNIALKPVATLRSILVRKRPSPALCLGSVYHVKCGSQDCSFSYVGESARPINKRKAEHVRNIRELDADKSELAKHVLDTGHRIDIDALTILEREPVWKKRIVKESLWTRRLHSSNKTKIDLGKFYDSIL